MRDYYNDNIDFKDDKALNIGLTAHALINLDEFDKVAKDAGWDAPLVFGGTITDYLW